MFLFIFMTEKKTELRVKPKPAAQVNKTFVLIVAAVVIFVLIWAISSAFTEQDHTGKKSKALTATADKPLQVSTAIKDIPENYNDMNAVARYAGGLQNNNVTAMQKELASLKAEHEMLEQQLLAISQAKGQQEPSRHEDLDSPQARSSGLFFSGIGSDQQSIMGGGMIQSATNYPGQPQQQQSQPQIPATPQQAAFFSQQSENAQKLAVMKAADNPEDIYDLHNMVTPVSPYEVQAGTTIPAVLISAINTTLAGTVVAQVRQNVFDSVKGKYLLIPKGSKLLGEYDSRVSYGQRRVLIAFNRVIRPDGSSILLGKPTSSDLQGAAGIEGNVDNHWGRVLGAATISTILSIGAGVVADKNTNGPNAAYIGARQGAFLGAASGISNTGQSIVNRALDVQPTITLPAGYEFNVIVKKDMVLTPYKSN